VRKRRNFNHL